MYDPDFFVPSAGTIKFLAQGGNNLRECTPPGNNVQIDSIFAAQATAATESWTLPAASSCPMRGFYFAGEQCPNAPYGPYSPLNPGPIASPDIVQIGNRFFMAFVGGNADVIMGRIYWAVSDDGITWTVFNSNPPEGFLWTPIITTPYGEQCTLFRGVGQVDLEYVATDFSMGPNGTFYIHFSYYHPGGEMDVLAYRFAYNPADNFGLSSSFYSNPQPGQLCIADYQTEKPLLPCSWYAHSGRLVWDYDKEPPAVPTDQVLQVYRGMRQMAFGAGDVIFDPLHNNWLHVYLEGTTLLSQTAQTLASSQWTDPQPLDLNGLDSALTSVYGGNYHPGERYYGGLWYGAFGTRTGLWLFQPVNVNNCPGLFGGLSIAPVELCSGTPSVSGVSPASGPTAGGTAVTVLGTNLDCASSVSFGGTPAATVTSRSPTSLTVPTPAHAAGAVSVAVTTPGGTYSLPNGFTYTVPPTGCGGPNNLALANQTVSGTQEFLACFTITAGNNFVVAATGNATFRAGTSITLEEGFSVAAGGTFAAIIDPSLAQ